MSPKCVADSTTMNNMTQEIEACVRANLATGLDMSLAAHGFTRRKDSLNYSRKLPEAVQQIRVSIEIHPKDQPNAAAAVYPYMRVSIDAVNALVREITSGGEDLAGTSDITLNQPIDFTAAKVARARWPIYQPDSVPSVVDDMKSFLEQYALPFLDVYSTPAGVCREYEDHGGARGGPLSYLHIVAAMVLCGRTADAIAVAERYYGRRTGTRKRYQRVFDYLAGLSKAQM